MTLLLVKVDLFYHLIYKIQIGSKLNKNVNYLI